MRRMLVNWFRLVRHVMLLKLFDLLLVAVSTLIALVRLGKVLMNVLVVTTSVVTFFPTL